MEALCTPRSLSLVPCSYCFLPVAAPAGSSAEHVSYPSLRCRAFDHTRPLSFGYASPTEHRA